ncbi:hypothetical protein GOL30_23320 [Sinorhizobium medicae]|uniref:hypothetical protein n=1 Tax=Sinorhizobium medicae TaxID=110321 RepID=UPI0011A76B66|nr:hypothetical protein [Sinorhizobium medicae]MDX0427373.1 hypothetical protein [Sinorhizobium medicae]MDX1077639.1 hypothetical protein [Sinorhizobium medicae]TWA28942.1 hypothetical protein FB004_101534 [Sinorhizobium medicae]
MLSKLFFFAVRTVIFLIFLGWLASKLLIGEIAPSQREDASSDFNSGSGLIVPSSDPRFIGDN